MSEEAEAVHFQDSWWHRHVVKEADRDNMGLGERIGNVIGVVFIVLVALFLIDLQVTDFGLFTSDFGTLDEVLFYGSLLFGVVPNLVRAATGKRNLGRFIDLFGTALFIVVASYFLVTFPFDFSQLVNLLPPSVRSDFGWFNNDLIKLLLEIGIFVSVVSLVYHAVLYWNVRGELRARRQAQ